ncbi:hypothetical protein MEJ65_00275 [Candidatus Carsonella ruddii]|uniref:Aspartyl/Glutamyl-tRNA(Gln) amidotransferase subunit B/E catalytic domain-containing protein n=4 Tax=cellular organisms TaxID=131567 RepID=A0AAJ6JXR9_CARRU|nr:hypothetical protein [Candidatus Carsonella ruddii]WGS66912.1 hypothetical protein MEJ62_00270 [Candidatus Carsonella ruddii]WGS67297.1 hypothetical protein MEJ65_00275 [Candidatus Carsonella ruddii]
MFLINNYFKIFIGCEIHIKCNLNKIFSHKKNNIYDISLPGVLPNFNIKIIKFVFLISFLLNGSCFYLTIIEKKLYFYYDLPKNYQLTQNNFQNIFNLIFKNKCNKKIILKKIHFEEDAASSKKRKNLQFINYNRSGNSLLEIVTEPLFNEYKCLINFIKKIKKNIFNNKISNLNMHLNEMRFDLNLSIINLFTFEKSKKIEIKNLNSFENLKKSIIYDFYRQILFLEKKKKKNLQTRSYNEKYTFKIRKKCFSKNYNYYIDYDFGYLINFDYEIFKKEKKKKIILEKFPKLIYKFLNKNKKKIFFNKNNYILKNFFFIFIILKKIKKYKFFFLYKKNIKIIFKIKCFFCINF